MIVLLHHYASTEMTPRPQFIDLKRRFKEVRKEENAEDAALNSYSAAWLWERQSLGWGELLKHPLVVVKGEPGSGKSWELENQASVSTVCPYSFYLRLDEMSQAGGSLPLRSAHTQRFADWRKSTGQALFFLDSVDEAKLRGPSDFERALDNFRAVLSPQERRRIRVVISTRITDFHHGTDEHSIRMCFPEIASEFSAAQEKTEKKSETRFPFVVSLLPLNRDAVGIYASARVPQKANAFLAAIDAAFAWDFARRPADVDDLLSYWNDQGNLGSLTDILNFVCDAQLRKTSHRKIAEVLSLHRARDGAQALAASTIWCGNLTFKIPDDPNAPIDALSAPDCLPPDWRADEVTALFNHAIFDGASYGRQRFHHRRLSEFLAAYWLADLMRRDCPVTELENLLFTTHRGIRILRPATAPVAAWLSTGNEWWNRQVRAWLLEAAPETVLRFGDPSQFSIEDRRRLLAALSERAGKRGYLWWETDESALSRLADVGLVPDINAILLSSDAGEGIQDMVLNLVRAGRLVGCAEAVLQIAIAGLSTGDVFPAAARALEVIADDGILARLANAADQIGQLPHSVCSLLATMLFPRHWSAGRLVQALANAKGSENQRRQWNYSLCEHLNGDAEKNGGVDVIRCLLKLPVPDEENASLDDDLDDESTPRWMLKLAVHAAFGLVSRSVLTSEECDAVAETLVRTRSGAGISDFPDMNEFAERTERFPALRRKFFRLAADRIAAEGEGENTRLQSVGIFYNDLQAVASDLGWLMEGIHRAQSPAERETATRWAIELWESLRRPSAILKELRKACRPFPESRKILWKSLHPGLFARLLRLKYRYLGYSSWRFKLRVIWRDMVLKYHHWKDRWTLIRYRKKVESGEKIGWIANLLPHGSDKWVPEDWSSLNKKYGESCARAVRAGSKRIWREYEPPLPYERIGQNSLTLGIHVGMAGIFAGWKDGDIVFQNLSDADARRATRYALYELNGFSTWFPELAKAHPLPVRDVLEQCIRAEWDIDPVGNESHLTIYDLSCYGADLRPLTRELLFSLIADREPKNQKIRDYAVRLLTADEGLAVKRIATLAALKAKQYRPDETGFTLWMSIWLNADALPALAYLASVLDQNDVSKAAMLNICANLSGQRHQHAHLKHRSWATPSAMRIFIPLLYQHVRVAEDYNRSDGGTYTPDSRDYAQEFRGSLLGILADTNEPEAGDVLRALQEHPILASHHDYIHHLIEKHSQQFTDLPKWRAMDIRAFAATFQREPQNDTDLFRLGVRRFENIKAWVEKGEDSPRDDVRPELQEVGVRKWLARQLVRQNEPAIIVPQEWEIDDGKRPDLRLSVPNIAPVSVELKVAEEWSFNELMERLENQLVGQYLRDHRARYGIYALAQFNKERTWKDDKSGSLIDAPALVEALQARADEIVKSRPDIHQIKVINICFTN